MEPIEIKNFLSGIASSPHTGFADIRNLDVSGKPGIVQLNLELHRQTPAAKTTTFTAVAATDIITIASGNFYNNPALTSAEGRAVVFTTSGTLPAGLSLATTYYLISVTATTYKVASTLANAIAGTQIDITDTGSGTHTITSVDMGRIVFMAKDQRTGILYGQDSNGKVWAKGYSSSGWVLISGNGTANVNSQGLVIWENYLFAFRSAKVDVFGPLTSALASQAWTNDFQTLTASAGETYFHHCYVSSVNNKMYFADRNTTTGTPYAGSFATATGTFDPATASTYTYTVQDLDLPQYKTITGFEDLGSQILISTTGREIYTWDGSSDSFDNIIFAPEVNISSMRTLNSVTYFTAGTRGNIYATVGSSAVLIREFPLSLTNIPFNSPTIVSLIAHKGRLFFNFYLQSGNISGVYSLDPITKALVLEHRISTATYTAASLPVLFSNGSGELLCSWNDGGVSGVDSTIYGSSDFYYQTSYGGYFDSAIYEVGTDLNKRKFTSIEFVLAKPLVSGQGIKLSYRTNLTSSFTTIGTFDFATYGAIQSFYKKSPGIPNCVMVQIRVELTVAASSTVSPELKSVTLR